jgi:acyl-CoA reductase-like NAD-dependent aldehyde dehydrogenase
LPSALNSSSVMPGRRRAPWGGRKASGMGSVYGPEGLQTYLATKCVFLPA